MKTKTNVKCGHGMAAVGKINKIDINWDDD